MKSLEDKIKELPPELRQEVEGFVDKLVQQVKQPRRKLTFSWEGALSDTEDDKSSVEVQHEVLEWRYKEK
jgi:hypothetical protein